MSSSNHIIIGLGGTGGKIICSLRKLIFRRHRTNEPEDINFGYLYLDTDEHFMDDNNPEWYEMGNSVHLNPSDNIHIKAETRELLELCSNPDNYPAIAEIIQPIPLLEKIIDTGQAGKVLGGQKRRLGRICFALRAKEILNLIERKIEGMKLNGEVTFHICCGLAGGTGSGIIVDLTCQLRKKYPLIEPFKNKILLYTLLPESHPGVKDFGNYHANGYAAMKELNGLALGKYLPIDVVRRRHNDPIRLLKEDILVPFNCCYVFSNENNKGVKVSVDKDIPEIISDFIYQKTIGARQINWEYLKRMENAENANDDHENNNRSLRFMSFGIRRLVFPQEEISDFIVIHLVQSFIYELKFLNWQDGLGWIEDKRTGFSVQDKVDEIMNKYGLNIPDLALLTPKFNEETNHTLESIFEQAKVVFKHGVENRHEGEKKKWTVIFKEKIESYYHQEIVGFFKRKRNELKDISEQLILRPLEKELFEHFINGRMSLSEVIDFLEKLKNNLSMLGNSIYDKQRNCEKKIRDLNNNVSLAEQEYLKSLANFIVSFISSQTKFNEFCDELNKMYLLKSYREAYLFSEELINRISTDLPKIKNSIENLDRTLQSIINDIDKKIPNLLSEDNTTIRTRIFNKDYVEQLQKRICRDKDKVDKLSVQLRLELTGNDSFENLMNPFERFNERYDTNRLFNILIKSIDKFLKRDSKASPDYYRDMRSEIIELLRREYEHREHDLVQYIRKEMENSAINVILDNTEMGISGPDVAETKCLEGSSIFVPINYNEQSTFINKLKQAFVKNGIQEDEIHDNNANPNEICITRLMNLIPARVFMRLSEYSTRYESLVNGTDAEIKSYVLHTENECLELPDIFSSDRLQLEEKIKKAQQEVNNQIIELQRNILPFLILLKHLDVFTPTKNGTIIQLFDEDGIETGRIAVNNEKLHLTINEWINYIQVKYPNPLSEIGVQQAIQEAIQGLQVIREKMLPIQSLCMEKLRAFIERGDTENHLKNLKDRIRTEIPEDVDHTDYPIYNEAVRIAMQRIKEQI